MQPRDWHTIPKRRDKIKKDSKGLKRHHDGITTSVESHPATEPAVTCSAKSQEEFKRAIDKLGIEYKIVYHPSVPKSNRLYDGGDWPDSSDGNDPVWRAMWPQLPPWIRNPENWEEEPEAGWNPNQVPVV